RLHLFLVVKIFRVGLLGRRALASAAQAAIVALGMVLPVRTALAHGGRRMARVVAVIVVVVMVVVATVQRRTDELPVGKCVLLRRTLDWNGSNGFLHGAPPTCPHACRKRFLRATTP